MCLDVCSLTDCGWRSPPRSVNLGNAHSNDCKLNGLLYNNPSLDRDRCWDASDYFYPPDGMLLGDVSTPVEQRGCPLGSQKDQCGSKPVYVTPDAPGGCHSTCVINSDTMNIHPDFTFDVETTCSDGGHGSFRIPMQMPAQQGPVSGTGVASGVQHYQEQFSAVGGGCLNGVCPMTTTQVAGRAGIPQEYYDYAATVKNYVYYEFVCPFGTQVRARASLFV